MAKGRFISRKVGRSRQLAALSNDTYRLMFLLMLPHADREGRLEADPELLNGVCFTRMDWTDEQVVAALQEMHEINLIFLYHVNENPFLFFPKFAEHQQGMRKDREAPSEIPAPPETTSSTNGGGVRSKSGVAPEEVPPKSKVKSKSKSKFKTPPTPPAESARGNQPGGLEELNNENAMRTLKRTAPGVAAAFEELARLQRSKFDAKLAQAKALLERIEEKGATAVEGSLRTILATAGDGGPLFTRAMRHLEKHAAPTPTSPDRRIFQLIGAKGVIDGQEFQVIAVTPDHAKLMTDIGQYLTPDEFSQYRVEPCLN